MLTNSHFCCVSLVPERPASSVEAFLVPGMIWFVVVVVGLLSLFC